ELLLPALDVADVVRTKHRLYLLSRCPGVRAKGSIDRPRPGRTGRRWWIGPAGCPLVDGRSSSRGPARSAGAPTAGALSLCGRCRLPGSGPGRLGELVLDGPQGGLGPG